MSTYIEKEKNLINAMKDQNFSAFGETPEEAFDTLERTLGAFPNYANAVIRMEQQLPIIRARYEGQDLIDHITDLDSRRRSAHNNAMASVSILNRMCEKYGVEPFADIDTEDRYEVAKFVGDYIDEVYGSGIDQKREVSRCEVNERLTKHFYGDNEKGQLDLLDEDEPEL